MRWTCFGRPPHASIQPPIKVSQPDGTGSDKCGNTSWSKTVRKMSDSVHILAHIFTDAFKCFSRACNKRTTMLSVYLSIGCTWCIAIIEKCSRVHFSANRLPRIRRSLNTEHGIWRNVVHESRAPTINPPAEFRYESDSALAFDNDDPTWKLPSQHTIWYTQNLANGRYSAISRNVHQRA